MRKLFMGAGTAIAWLLAGLAILIIALIGFFLVDLLTLGNRFAAYAVFYAVEIVGQVAIAYFLSRPQSAWGIIGRSVPQGLHVTVASLYLMTYPPEREQLLMIAVSLPMGILLGLVGHTLAHRRRNRRR